MLVKPEQKPGYAELMIDTTSSHTCTKPHEQRIAKAPIPDGSGLLRFVLSDFNFLGFRLYD